MPTQNAERRPLVSRQVSIGRPSWKSQVACGAILLTVAFERIAFYGLVGNLVLFLNHAPLNWASYSASNAALFFTGISFCTAILGGWLADAYLGRFKTIILFFVIYIGGYAFFPFLSPYGLNDPGTSSPPEWCAGTKTVGNQTVQTTAVNETLAVKRVGIVDDLQPWPTIHPSNPGPDMTCTWAVFLSLGIIGLGNGAVKLNLAPFGADQLCLEGVHRPKMMRAFFNWYYWCINISSFIALGALGYVQQEISFFWGYVAAAASLVVALAVFIIGGIWYLQVPAVGSLLSNICQVIAEACRSKNRPLPTNTTLEPDPPSCLDRAKICYGGSFHDNIVDDIKVVGRIMLIFLVLIPYWMVYFQMETTFVSQGLHLRWDFNDKNTTLNAPDDFHIPAAWLSLFDAIFLIILLPIMDRIIYPWLDGRGHSPSLRARIAIGMVFSFASVCTAGGLEMYRMHVLWLNGTEHGHPQIVGNSTYYAADLSILWQIPQYGLIGISEVFASVAGLELAYSESPRSLQGIIMGLFWFCQGLGSMFGTLVLSSFYGIWFFRFDHGNINCRHHEDTDRPGRYYSCHLDYYFFVLAALQLVGLFIFLYVAKKLDIGIYKNREEQRRFSRQNSRLSLGSTVSHGNGRPNNSSQETMVRNGRVQTPSSISSADTLS